SPWTASCCPTTAATSTCRTRTTSPPRQLTCCTRQGYRSTIGRRSSFRRRRARPRHGSQSAVMQASGRWTPSRPWPSDSRSCAGQLPCPEVAGKRRLAVDTYDGFPAFELERREAAKVAAIDTDDHDRWDWPPDVPAEGGARLATLAGPEKGRSFRVPPAALGS